MDQAGEADSDASMESDNLWQQHRLTVVAGLGVAVYWESGAEWRGGWRGGWWGVGGVGGGAAGRGVGCGGGGGQEWGVGGGGGGGKGADVGVGVCVVGGFVGQV